MVDTDDVIVYCPQCRAEMEYEFAGVDADGDDVYLWRCRPCDQWFP